MGPGTAAEVPKYLFIRSGRRNVKFEHAMDPSVTTMSVGCSRGDYSTADDAGRPKPATSAPPRSVRPSSPAEYASFPIVSLRCTSPIAGSPCRNEY
jgi:hypothetical protein